MKFCTASHWQAVGTEIRVQRDLRCQHRAGQRWATTEIWQNVMARCYASGLQTDAAIGLIVAALK